LYILFQECLFLADLELKKGGDLTGLQSG